MGRPAPAPAGDAPACGPAPAAGPARRKAACRCGPITVSTPFSMALHLVFQRHSSQTRASGPACCRTARCSARCRRSAPGHAPGSRRWMQFPAASAQRVLCRRTGPSRHRKLHTRNTRPKVDFPQATGPVMPMISPGWAVRFSPAKIGSLGHTQRTDPLALHRRGRAQPASSGCFRQSSSAV